MCDAVSRKANIRSAVAEKSTGSNVLVGRYDHGLDPKFRLMIPAEWRAALGDPEYVYVFPDPAHECLDLIPKEEMEKRLESLRERAIFDASLTDDLQAISESAKQLMVDTAGRIRISNKLLAFAGLTDVVAMVGAVRMARLWNPARLGPADKVDVERFRSAAARLGF